jgi:hypothetical protein
MVKRFMKWQCKFYDKDGRRCESEAVARLHFSPDHPFDHIDVCEEHKKEYPTWAWMQLDLQNYGLPD